MRRGLHGAKHAGFTLIELLVVVAIIGILSSIVLISVHTAKVKGNDARRIADLRHIEAQLAILAGSGNMALTGCDGGTGHDLISQCTGNAAALKQFSDPNGSAECNGSWYLGQTGTPMSTSPCQYTIGPSWHGVHEAGAEADDYEVCTYLEHGVGGLSAGLVNINSTFGSSPGNIVQGCN